MKRTCLRPSNLFTMTALKFKLHLHLKLLINKCWGEKTPLANYYKFNIQVFLKYAVDSPGFLIHFPESDPRVINVATVRCVRNNLFLGLWSSVGGRWEAHYWSPRREEKPRKVEIFAAVAPTFLKNTRAIFTYCRLVILLHLKIGQGSGTANDFSIFFFFLQIKDKKRKEKKWQGYEIRHADLNNILARIATLFPKRTLVVCCFAFVCFNYLQILHWYKVS